VAFVSGVSGGSRAKPRLQIPAWIGETAPARWKMFDAPASKHLQSAPDIGRDPWNSSGAQEDV